MSCNLSHKDREFYPTIIRGGRLIHNIRGGSDLYWSSSQPISGTVAAESCSLFVLLRHRTPSSPMCLSEAIHKPFALS